MTIKNSSITDIPRDVKAGEEDTFGIDPFEKGLVRFLKTTSTPITVALQGEWGSGKTSLMNSLKQSLCDNDNALYHDVWLNTWEYALMKDAQSTLIDIVMGLIEEVTKIANIDETEVQKLGKKVMGIGGNLLKFAGKTALNTVADGVGDVVTDSLKTKEKEATIGQVRQELENIIADCIKKDGKQGFIFFIDDLDRIDPPVAVELLELLKNIFTLKNCVFVLAIDYDVVIKGLEPKFGKLTSENEREFRSFFDKIIQVPFSMPVGSYQPSSFLKTSLKTIDYLNDEQISNDELIGKFTEISSLTVGSNPRALKRLLNSLSLINCINAEKNDDEHNALDDDIELLINFAMVSTQVAYPTIYRLLVAHPAFDKWDESVAVKFNLKQLDDDTKHKLDVLEEFDEEWEQILFRLCETDYFLKKRALNISRLLNTLRTMITDKKLEIEETIESIISLSSVTSLEAFDTPVAEYNDDYWRKTASDTSFEVVNSILEIVNQFTPNICTPHFTKKYIAIMNGTHRLRCFTIGPKKKFVNLDYWDFTADAEGWVKKLNDAGIKTKYMEKFNYLQVKISNIDELQQHGEILCELMKVAFETSSYGDI